MRGISEFLERNRKAWLIWCSTIDKGRSLYEISNEWNYKSKGAIYQKKNKKDLLKEMEKLGLIETIKDNSEYPPKTIVNAKFEWLIDYIFQLDNIVNSVDKAKQQKFIQILDKHREDFANFFKQEWFRKTFFDVGRLKNLFRKEALNVQNNFSFLSFIICLLLGYKEEYLSRLELAFGLISSSDNKVDPLSYFHSIKKDFELHRKEFQKLSIIIGGIVKDIAQEFQEDIREGVLNISKALLNQNGYQIPT